MRNVVESAGAIWRPIPYNDMTAATPLEQKLDGDTLSKYVPDGTPESELVGPGMIPFISELVLPNLIEDLRTLSPPPSVVVYDTFLAFAPVAAHALGINSIGMLTMPGPGALKRPDAVIDDIESKPWVQGPREALLRDYGYDILKGGLVMESYSPVQNIVTTIDEMYMTASNDRQRQRLAGLPHLCVGPLVDSSLKRVANVNVSDAVEMSSSDFWSPLPWDRINSAIVEGQKIVFVSLGTVATSYFWDKVFGPFGLENGVSDVTGREFCDQVWNSSLEALGGRDDVLVVLAIGNADGALDCLPVNLPENVILRAAVPQLELLAKCSAFVTHGGANSVHEALLFGVPLVVVPIFGDQPSNGEQVQGNGAGVCFKDPLRTATPEALRCAVGNLVDLESQSSGNQYQLAASALAKSFKLAGGVPKATNEIMRLAVKDTAWLGA